MAKRYPPLVGFQGVKQEATLLFYFNKKPTAVFCVGLGILRELVISEVANVRS